MRAGSDPAPLLRDVDDVMAIELRRLFRDEAASTQLPVDRIGSEVAEMLRALAARTVELNERAESEAARIVEEAREQAWALVAHAEREAEGLRRDAAEELAAAQQVAEVFRQLTNVVQRARQPRE